MTVLEFCKQVIKDGLNNLLSIIVVIVAVCVLGIPCFIGLAMDSIPVVLFGIIFAAAFGAALAKRVFEHERKNYIKNGGNFD